MIALLSLVLAVSSAMVLRVAAGGKLSEPFATWYDRTELFLRDTVRLSFKTNLRGSKSLADVFVAPPGILDEVKVFNWVDSFTDLGRVSENSAQKPKAPVRVLDPQWQPNFNSN